VIAPARLLSALASSAARRPLATVLVLGVLGLAGAVLAALDLRPSTDASTLVARSSQTYKATQRFYSRFGEEPIDVVVSGDLRKLLLSDDVDRLLGLEGCLSGNLPATAFTSEGGSSGPCARLARAKAVKVVLGPGTFINEAALQIDRSLAAKRRQAEAQARQARDAVFRAARARGVEPAQAHVLASEASKATIAGFAAEVSALAIRYGLTAAPSLDDHQFVSTLVFDSSKPSGTPKQRFAYLFPSREAALVSVRLKAGLSASQRASTLATIRQAVAMRPWRLRNGESYLVTGEPVVAHDLESSIAHSIELLLLVVLVTIGLILSLVFRARPRQLPLAVALLAAALTLGAGALVGVSLTMASVAVLPVLVGLAVDYAIQFQTRLREATDGGLDAHGAVAHAARHGAPAIATAALASAVGLLVLGLSPVPMVRGFGLVLVVGVAVAFVCALTLSAATLALSEERRGGVPRASARPRAARLPGFGGRRSPPAARAGAALTGAWQGARDLLADNAVNRFVARLSLERAVARPGRVLAIGLALAAVGWGLDTQTAVQTDVAKLAPQGMTSLADLRTLERASGVGGEIDLMVSSDSLAKPSTIEWMSSYERTVLRRFGYDAAHGCGHARLCPAFSLPDLFSSGEGAPAKLTSAQVEGLLRVIPPYFSQAVISADRRVATLTFGIRLMPLQDQQRVIESMRSSLHPPAGVGAQLVGLSVLAASAGAQVASPWRRALTLLAALAAVALALLLAFRGQRRRALVPFVPVVLATGWSGLVLFVTRVPLNPMSVTLGALVIAISTEFSVLLSERVRQETLAGHDIAAALRRAYRHTGAAVAASAATAIAGFGVLAFSDIAMLRDFGLVTLLDLTVALVGVLVALPATVVLVGRKERLWARAGRATSPSLG
jgi:uncharacterized protein